MSELIQNKKKIPTSWSYKRIDEISDVSRGISWKKTEEHTTATKGEHRVYKIPHVQSYSRYILKDDPIYISKDVNKEKYLLKKNDLLMVGSNGNPQRVGNVAIVHNEEQALFASFLLRLRVKESIHNRFFYYQLISSVIQDAISGDSSGTTGLKNINSTQMKELEVPLPPYSEQQKIAAILSSVDEAIEKTEQIIAQTEKVKKGLMQQLLTKGVGHKEYVNTPIGEVPEEWEIKKIEEIGDLASGTTPNRKNSEYYDLGNIPWVKTMDLTNSYLFSTQEKITKKAMMNTSLKWVPRGSVLIAMYGGFNQIGRTGLLKVDATINQALTAVIITEKSKVLSEFLQNWLNYRVGFWRNYAASSRKDPNITKSDVKSFLVAVPPKDEQHEIVKILSNFDKKIDIEKKKSVKLDLIKKGLMQQLLTGRVRVPLDKEEVIEA